MSLVIGGVSCDELRSGVEEGISWQGGPSATKAFLCDWGDRFSVANALLGLATYAISGGKLQITAPGQYPESQNLFAREVTIQGVGPYLPGSRQSQFTYAVVRVRYAVPTYAISAGMDGGGINSFDPSAPLIYATQEIDFGGQVITVPRSKLKIAGGATLDQDFGRFVGVNHLTVTLHFVPFLVTYAVRSLIGRMNNAQFFSSATGTLMFNGIKTRRDAGADGTLTQETTLSFAERPEAPWDYIYTGGGTSGAYPGWEQTIRESDSGPSVPSGDFSQIVPAFYRSV